MHITSMSLAENNNTRWPLFRQCKILHGSRHSSAALGMLSVTDTMLIQ